MVIPGTDSHWRLSTIPDLVLILVLITSILSGEMVRW
jgi:hypothetical protein